MYTYKECDWFIREKVTDNLCTIQGIPYSNITDEQLDREANVLIQQFGFGPHDIQGRIIKVGDKCAVALTIDRSSNLAIIEVVAINGFKIKAKNIVRTYSSVDSDKIITYAFPERMVVLE